MKHYLEDLAGRWRRAGCEPVNCCRGHRAINVHPVVDVEKPLSRAEVISTGKGLLDRVAIVVQGARSELGERPLRFDFLLPY